MSKSKILLLVLTAFILTGCTNVDNGYSNSSNENEDSSSQTNVEVNSNFAKSNKYTAAPAVLPAEQLVGRKAHVKTEKGDFTIELYGDVAPQTVSNFIFLANEGFYDGLVIHRREEDFVVQTGDPLGEDSARRGTGGPGYTVPAEISSLSHTRGIVATARTSDYVNPEKASSGSQFYVVLPETEATFLDNEYTIFGKVDAAGMEVVDKLKVGDRIIEVVIE